MSLIIKYKGEFVFAFKMRLKFDDFFSMGFLTMVNNDDN